MEPWQFRRCFGMIGSQSGNANKMLPIARKYPRIFCISTSKNKNQDKWNITAIFSKEKFWTSKPDIRNNISKIGPLDHWTRAQQGSCWWNTKLSGLQAKLRNHKGLSNEARQETRQAARLRKRNTELNDWKAKVRQQSLQRHVCNMPNFHATNNSNNNQLLFVSSRPGKAVVSHPPGAIFREICEKLHTL